MTNSFLKSIFLELELEIGFNVHIQSKLLLHTFVMGASSDLGQSFHPRKNKMVGFGLGKEQVILQQHSR